MGTSDWLFFNGISSKCLMNFNIYLFHNAGNMEITELPTLYIKIKFSFFIVCALKFFAYPNQNYVLYII